MFFSKTVQRQQRFLAHIINRNEVHFILKKKKKKKKKIDLHFDYKKRSTFSGKRSYCQTNVTIKEKMTG